MISFIHVVIFFAFVYVDFSEGFFSCEKGKKIEIGCPYPSLISGIQTESHFFGAGATPVCSDMKGEIRQGNSEASRFGKDDYYYDDDYHSFRPSRPKVFCGHGNALKGITICSDGGAVEETFSECRTMNSFSDSKVYTVVAMRYSPVLKCKEGSVLNGIRYGYDAENNMIATATCIQQKPPSALQNCSVEQKTKNSLLVSCYKDLDGGLNPSFEMEVYGPDSSLLYSLPSNTADFSLRGLDPGTVYSLVIYAVNAAGRSSPLTINVSTLSSPRRRTGKEGCEDGELVKIACPKGYQITGVETSSKIFSPDAYPVCTKMTHKIVSENRPAKMRFYSGFNPLVQADCSGTHPIVWKFSMCFVNGALRTTETECRRFQDHVTVTAYYSIEGQPDSSTMRCPEGSFFHGLRMEQDGDDVKVLGKCTVIEE